MTKTDELGGAAIGEVDFSRIVNVEPGYRHYPKQIGPGPDFARADTYLKWYEVFAPDEPIPADIDARARAFLAGETGSGRLDLAGEMGFVIVHRCGESFYFLIVCTWRNNNEMWETVYTMDSATGTTFTEVAQQRRLEVICVWEMGAVMHEQQAWIRYLYSARDDEAKRAYIADRFAGLV